MVRKPPNMQKVLWKREDSCFLYPDRSCIMDLYRPDLLWPWLEEREDTGMRRDKITAAAFAAAAAVLMFSGCSGRQEETAVETAEETAAETEAVESSGEAEAESAKESGPEELVIYDDTEQADDGLTFDDLKNIQFVFSSGAGGWSTLLDIRPDGSFEGEYFDSDMGSTGEGYPNGTVYLCDFKGRFTEPEKIDEHTYAVKIASMEYKQEAGTREIKDSILYEYTDVHGLDGADRILIHLPGTPLESLSEELRSWIGYYDLSAAEETELSFYVLDNEKEQLGFRGWDSFQGVRDFIENTEKWTLKLEEELETDSSLTQTDLNSKSQEIYELWDSALNQLWDVLEKSKTSQEMEKLLSEQRQWIKQKEAAAEDAGAAYEGGTLQSMAVSQKAAELTKERVYELLEYLD